MRGTNRHEIACRIDWSKKIGDASSFRKVTFSRFFQELVFFSTVIGQPRFARLDRPPKILKTIGVVDNDANEHKDNGKIESIW